ncbi:S1 RNA-binding domain-containing protein [Candidatus Marsarchaeota archaeon]|jgi:translation initiation factor 2 subunit 1|nr:S1 RNA-binding domain-containing protein [Candidatus Marsarchaeota archaeon]
MAFSTQVPYPNTLVIAQVTKIMRFGAYCKLLEYNNIEAFLPFREISSGWIKNIHEFLHPEQKIVCKVIYIDRNKGTIDISLKKVTPKDSKVKINAYNLEHRLNSIFLQAVRASGEDRQKEQLAQQALSEFGSYTALVQAATGVTDEWKGSKLPKKLKDAILSIIEASRKRRKYEVAYMMKLSTSNTTSGISELNSALLDAEKSGVSIMYISAPKYRMDAQGKDYSDAENKIKAAIELIRSKVKDSTLELEKEKLKKDKESILDALQ